MTDAELLLRACRLSPDEDTPRLALADELQATGFEGAAEYIRESVEHDRAGGRTSGTVLRRRRKRQKMARDWCRWFEGLLGLPRLALVGGESWDFFHWRDRDLWDGSRECRLDIVRGLPMGVSVTCPMLMERAGLVFLFPLMHAFVTGRKPQREPGMTLDGYVIEPHWLWVPRSYPQTFSTWEEEKWEIPHPLYRHLPAGDYGTGGFRKLADAVAGLNTAALAFGRAAVAASTSAA